MKKIITGLLFLLFLLSSCAGYEPIFSSKNLQFKISNYTLQGDKILGNKIYSKLNNLSKLNKNEENKNIFDLFINISKDKVGTSKDSAGKILEYKITLKANIHFTDITINEKKIEETYTYSSSYKVQSQFSDTINAENVTIENLLDKMHQELLIKLSENIE